MFDIRISDDLETLTLSLMEGKTLDPEATEDEVFEAITSNSNFYTIPEGTIAGDLTSAPMLGVLSEEEIGEAGVGTNRVHVGAWGDPVRVRCRRVIARWAFMDYQVWDLADMLRERGRAVFQGGLVLAQPQDLDLDHDELPKGLWRVLMDRKLGQWHDKVSDLVEDPDCDKEELRKAAARLLVRLNVLDALKQRSLKSLLRL